jgi:hypothetical protein
MHALSKRQKKRQTGALHKSAGRAPGGTWVMYLTYRAFLHSATISV